MKMNEFEALERKNKKVKEARMILEIMEQGYDLEIADLERDVVLSLNKNDEIYSLVKKVLRDYAKEFENKIANLIECI